VPILLTLRPLVSKSKVAVTYVAWPTETMHVPVPAQGPDQPANVDIGSAMAVSVTKALLAKFAEQVVPQSIPQGDEVT
jgi:hypothetical protein